MKSAPNALRLAALSTILLLSACMQTPAPRPTATRLATATITAAIPTRTPPPSPTATKAASPSPLPTDQPVQACSPLAEVALQELADTIVNPFAPPAPGSDDPHQGVDFARLDADTRIALSGAPVAAALGGRVAGVIEGRFPYGNAVIIETSLEALPPGVAAELPAPEPTRPAHSALTCPEVDGAITWEGQARSLYLLYAHLQAPVALAAGDQVACGETLGATGDSGNALNPHLHLEARLGPAGAVFAGMAHYESRATPLEMRAYCDWRVSGLFQLVNPLDMLGLTP